VEACRAAATLPRAAVESRTAATIATVGLSNGSTRNRTATAAGTLQTAAPGAATPLPGALTERPPIQDDLSALLPLVPGVVRACHREHGRTALRPGDSGRPDQRRFAIAPQGGSGSSAPPKHVWFPAG
jgi:hypothetical protein